MPATFAARGLSPTALNWKPSLDRPSSHHTKIVAPMTMTKPQWSVYCLPKRGGRTAVSNIPDYPPIDEVLAGIRRLPRACLVEADALARQAGSARASNMVMVGAASPLLPVRFATIEHFVETAFAAKGTKVVETNLKALHAGRASAAAAP